MIDGIKEYEKIRNKVKFYKSTFEKIPAKRRQKILDVATSEFAAKGYNGTNINVIAKKSGISIGSMYSYFNSKEDLFLTVVDIGFHLLEKALNEVNIRDDNIFKVFEKLLRSSRRYAIDFPQLNQIYLDSTTQGLAKLSSKLSRQFESITVDLYCDVIRTAKEKGIINANIDERLTAFYIDNLIIMFQFSYTSDYYKERMKIFLGSETIRDEEKIVMELVGFVRKALSS